MTPTVEQLWDIEQIKQLKARYFRFIDTKDWDGFRDLFTDDCVHHTPVESGERVQANEEYLATTIPLLANGVTVHHGHMPEIEVTGPRDAKGIWAMYDLLIGPTPDGNGQARYEGYGHYVERYAKGDDARWRIAHLHLRRLHLVLERHVRDLDVSVFDRWEAS